MPSPELPSLGYEKGFAPGQGEHRTPVPYAKLFLRCIARASEAKAAENYFFRDFS
jgi:hypothetical protein